MVKEVYIIVMKIYILEILKMMKSVEKELFFGKTEINMKVNFIKIRLKEKED